MFLLVIIRLEISKYLNSKYTEDEKKVECDLSGKDIITFHGTKNMSNHLQCSHSDQYKQYL